MTYKVQALRQDTYSIELGADPAVEDLATFRSRNQALKHAQELHEKLSGGNENTIYNYSSIIVTNSDNDVLFVGNFDTEYITEARAHELLNELIDSNHEPVSVFDNKYKASDVLYRVDPYTYVTLLNAYLSDKKLVVV